MHHLQLSQNERQFPCFSVIALSVGPNVFNFFFHEIWYFLRKRGPNQYLSNCPPTPPLTQH